MSSFLKLTEDTISSKFRSIPSAPDGRYDFEVSQDPRIRETGGHSGFINGVAKRHGEVSQAMFPQFRVESITNGVHASTWVAPEIAALFDDHLPGWREDNTLLGDADAISLEELRAAHLAAKGTLLREVIRRNGVALDPAVLTIGIARRAAAYKRNDLIFSDLDALTKLVDRRGSLQILCSGKAHPDDVAGKALIAHITELASELSGAITVVYLTDYGMRLAARLVAGVDVWLNNPIAPREASGTSGMKAAMNGVPSLSTLDGWWLEGCVEGVTGWAIGTDRGADARDDQQRQVQTGQHGGVRVGGPAPQAHGYQDDPRLIAVPHVADHLEHEPLVSAIPLEQREDPDPQVVAVEDHVHLAGRAVALVKDGVAGGDAHRLHRRRY